MTVQFDNRCFEIVYQNVEFHQQLKLIG